MTGPGDSEISDESRVLADRARRRAEAMPSAADLAAIAADALSNTSRSDMTPDEIRQIAAEALAKAQEVSYLLGRLAGILGDRPGET